MSKVRKSTFISFIAALMLIGLMMSAIIAWWGYSLYAEDPTTRRLHMVIGEGATLWTLMMVSLVGLFFMYRRDLRRSEEMKTLFALWTHECKTPIASIQLQAETLLLNDRADESSKKYLGRIVQDCTRLQHFVERILQIVRTQTVPHLRVTPGPLHEDIEAWWNQLGRDYFKNQLRLNFRGEAPLWGYREPEALGHVLNNVIENSVKYSSNPEVLVDFEDSTDGPVVRIRSTHSEFPGQELKRLGELFFRGTNAQKTGAGVGLFLVQQLMRKMGGAVNFYNERHEAVVELVFRPYRHLGEAHG